MRIPQHLSSANEPLATSVDKFGPLRDSSPFAFQPAVLRERMEEDGYLYLSGLLDRDEVLAARQQICECLQADGQLQPGSDPLDCLAREGSDLTFVPHLATENPTILKVLYNGAMMAFWQRFFGEPVLHLDFTWFRAVAPGNATHPHTDAVYMNRGTQELYTAWTPFGDVPLENGGLMILKNSHRHQKLRDNYSSKDVDAFCENRRPADFAQMGGGGNIRAGHALSNRPATLREKLGGRWLTADYHAGDVLFFSIFTVHCSLDNHSAAIRLTSDSRYQRASEPADERWMGPAPTGHGAAAKRGMIC